MSVSVVLFIQRAKRMRHIILFSVVCLGVPYLSTYKGHDFRKKLLNIKCVFCFYLQILLETSPILRRLLQRDIINIHTYVFMYGIR